MAGHHPESIAMPAVTMLLMEAKYFAGLCGYVGSLDTFLSGSWHNPGSKTTSGLRH